MYINTSCTYIFLKYISAYQHIRISSGPKSITVVICSIYKSLMLPDMQQAGIKVGCENDECSHFPMRRYFFLATFSSAIAGFGEMFKMKLVHDDGKYYQDGKPTNHFNELCKVELG